MRRYPFGKIGIDGHQLDAEANADQEAEQDNHLCALLERHQQRKRAVPRQRAHKGQAATKTVGVGRKQTRADKQTEESSGGKCGLVGDAEHARRTGMKHARRHQAGADIAGFKQIVELKEAAQRQQRDKAPQAGGRGQRINAPG